MPKPKESHRGRCRWYAICPMRRYEAAGLIDAALATDPWCRSDWSHCARYQAELRGRPHPDNLLPDGTYDENLP